MENKYKAPWKAMKQLLREDRGAVSSVPRRSRTKSSVGRSQVRRRWMVEETQKTPKVEVEQFPKEKGDVEGRRSGAELH